MENCGNGLIWNAENQQWYNFGKWTISKWGESRVAESGWFGIEKNQELHRNG